MELIKTKTKVDLANLTTEKQKLSLFSKIKRKLFKKKSERNQKFINYEFSAKGLLK